MVLVNSWMVAILWHASQIYIYDGIKVGLFLYQCRLCDVKCIESDSHSASYTSFMMDNINAMMYLK